MMMMMMYSCIKLLQPIAALNKRTLLLPIPVQSNTTPCRLEFRLIWSDYGDREEISAAFAKLALWKDTGLKPVATTIAGYATN